MIYFLPTFLFIFVMTLLFGVLSGLKFWIIVQVIFKRVESDSIAIYIFNSVSEGLHSNFHHLTSYFPCNDCLLLASGQDYHLLEFSVLKWGVFMNKIKKGHFEYIWRFFQLVE